MGKNGLPRYTPLAEAKLKEKGQFYIKCLPDVFEKTYFKYFNDVRL